MKGTFRDDGVTIDLEDPEAYRDRIGERVEFEVRGYPATGTVVLDAGVPVVRYECSWMSPEEWERRRC